ncbi:MAG: aminotransferase class V-fold PLP-dependent enzyme [Bacilli bacterium]
MYDVYKIRKDFPMLQNKMMQNHPLVFLDNASTTFKPYKVIEYTDKYYKDMTSNSHRGDYDLCYYMDEEVRKTRLAVSKFINCDENEVVFTSGTSMSINMIAWGYGFKFLKKDDEIIISEAEHASNVLPWFKICELTGAKIVYVPLTEDGRITPDNLKKVISKNTKVVALAHVGNVLAYLLPVKEITKIAHEVGAIVALDGAQSVPHMKVDFKDLDVDFLSFSAHKMCGPTGIGCMIGKYELLEKMDPLLSGGGMNAKFHLCGDVSYLNPPFKFEAGTDNLAGIMGFRAAVEYLTDIGMDNIVEHEKEIRKYAIEQLEKLDNIILYNKDAEGGIITFNVKDVFAQDEATLLNSYGIAVRSGEHCAKILIDFLKTPATVRASIYLYTTKEEIDAFVKALKEGDFLDAYFTN